MAMNPPRPEPSNSRLVIHRMADTSLMNCRLQITVPSTINGPIILNAATQVPDELSNSNRDFLLRPVLASTVWDRCWPVARTAVRTVRK